MSEFHKNIHEKAVRWAKQFRRCEAELIDAIILVWVNRIFEKLNYPSLFAYCVQELGLSEGSAYGFMQVAKKSQQIPELKEAIEKEEITVSQARRIVPVLKEEKSPEENLEWIQKAKDLSQKSLEKEVAKVNPKSKVHEKIRPVAKSLCELRCAITPEVEEKIRRIQDLLSQKKKKNCDLGEVISAMAELYLEKEDPLRKAQRAQSKIERKTKFCETSSLQNKSHTNNLNPKSASRTKRKKLSSQVQHQIQLRSEGRCEHIGSDGRCPQTRWLDIHHIIAISQGGSDELENLLLLCQRHHRLEHSEYRGNFFQ